MIPLSGLKGFTTKSPAPILYAITFSILTTILSLGWFGIHGLNLGIDFQGGSAIEIRSTQGEADPAQIRELVGALDLGEVQVQGFGSALLGSLFYSACGLVIDTALQRLFGRRMLIKDR